MSKIGKNIKKIRMVKKMSQSEFANLFKLARPSVGAYEEGRAEPKIETLIQIGKHFELSIDTLLNKELTINELLKFDIFREEFHAGEKLQEDKDQVKEQTPFVALDQLLDYIVNYQNKDFINNLPVIQFPFTQTEKSRAFQIEGSKMENGNSGLHHKDILLCHPVKDYSSSELEKVYVIVSKKGVYFRRLKSSGSKELVFKADNSAFDPITFKHDEILELWQAYGFFSENMKPPSLLEERVSILESKLMGV